MSIPLELLAILTVAIGSAFGVAAWAIKSLVGSVLKMNEALSEHNDQRQQWEQDSRRLSEQIMTLEDERAGLRGELDTLRKESRALREDSDNLRSDIKTLREDVTKRNEVIASLQDDLNKRTQDLKTLRRDLDHRNARIAVLESQVKGLEDERRDLLQKMTRIELEREQERTEFNQRLKALQVALDEASSQRESAEADRVAKQAEIEELRAQVDRLEMRLNAVNGEGKTTENQSGKDKTP